LFRKFTYLWKEKKVSDLTDDKEDDLSSSNSEDDKELDKVRIREILYHTECGTLSVVHCIKYSEFYTNIFKGTE